MAQVIEWCFTPGILIRNLCSQHVQDTETSDCSWRHCYCANVWICNKRLLPYLLITTSTCHLEANWLDSVWQQWLTKCNYYCHFRGCLQCTFDDLKKPEWWTNAFPEKIMCLHTFAFICAFSGSVGSYSHQVSCQCQPSTNADVPASDRPQPCPAAGPEGLLQARNVSL